MKESAEVRIGEFARRHGVTVQTLRYYESEGLLAPRRDGAGRRLYDVSEQLVVPVITALRAAGFGIRDIADLIAVKQPDASVDERLDASEQVLARLRAQLVERRTAVDRAEVLLSRWQGEIDEYRAGSANVG